MYETQIAPRGQKTPPQGNMPGVLAEPGPQVRDAATSYLAAGTPLSLWCRRCAATIASTVPQSPSSCRWRSRRREEEEGDGGDLSQARGHSCSRRLPDVVQEEKEEEEEAAQASRLLFTRLSLVFLHYTGLLVGG